MIPGGELERSSVHHDLVGPCVHMSPQEKADGVRRDHPKAEEIPLGKGSVVYFLNKSGVGKKRRLGQGISALLLDECLGRLKNVQALIALDESSYSRDVWIRSGGEPVKNRELETVNVGDYFGRMGQRPYWWRTEG